ncbi:MAG: hypothetical protein HYY17_15250 [Planctomycetes bacterium]|nr:hypothetical protein [Planctomycetota bacterium]
MLTLLLAATVGCATPDARFVAVLAAHVQQLSDAAPASSEEPPVTVATIPYYYERISDVVAPATPILISYDARLPIFRDLP